LQRHAEGVTRTEAECCSRVRDQQRNAMGLVPRNAARNDLDEVLIIATHLGVQHDVKDRTSLGSWVAQRAKQRIAHRSKLSQRDTGAPWHSFVC
jgi:hypothetical protein